MVYQNPTAVFQCDEGDHGLTVLVDNVQFKDAIEEAYNHGWVFDISSKVCICPLCAKDGDPERMKAMRAKVKEFLDEHERAVIDQRFKDMMGASRE